MDYFTELPDLSWMLYGVDRALQSPTEDEETEDGRSESDSEPGNSSKSRPAHNHSNKPGQAGEQSQERASESDASPSDPDAASDASDVCEEEEFVRRARTPFQRKYRKLYWMLCEIVNDYSLLSFLPLDINVGMEERC